MNAAGNTAVRARLTQGLTQCRWHFQHGPIDLIIELEADFGLRESAIEQTWARFARILPALVMDLPRLRRPAAERPRLHSSAANRMLRACTPFAAERFITPMAAVAGAVADELLAPLQRHGIRRGFINNGGDIALLLAPGADYRVGIWPRVGPGGAPTGLELANGSNLGLEGAFTVSAEMPVRGIATSGWRGRSFSLGIADSVTVLAADAASADVAATLIANAVNCEHTAIVRAPAEALKDDTDLGARLVTVDVPVLPPAAVALALARGRSEAEHWQQRGLVYAAALFLQARTEVLLPPGASPFAAGRPGARERVTA
jgi:ApbE superfamily uncharacterized protein (UPF0280 family)